MFADRAEAGTLLAEKLGNFRDKPDTVVLGIPRGGVVVAYQVAQALGLPLDIVCAAKVGAPGHPEYAVGAVAPDGVVLANPDVRFPVEELTVLAAPALDKIAHELEIFRRGKEPIAVAGKTTILVDDGLATGLTAMAAADWLFRQGAGHIVVAMPVAPSDTIAAMADHASEMVILEVPALFSAVGQFYRDFSQTEDAEVLELLGR